MITHSLMVLSVPGRDPAARREPADPYPEVLRALADAELAALVASFEPAPGADTRGARDWSDLDQRMHYIVHLFRAFHEDATCRRAVHAGAGGAVPGGRDPGGRPLARLDQDLQRARADELLERVAGALERVGAA